MFKKTKENDGAKELSELERMVMQIVWEKGRVTAKQVKEALDETKSLALTTILTVLSRLKEKRYIKEVPSLGRSAVFQAIVPKEKVAFKTVRRVLMQFFSDSPSTLMAHLLKNEDITDEELAEIRRLLTTKTSKNIKKERKD